MPKWSSAYNNHFSNMAKLLAPTNEGFSSIIGRAQEILVNNNPEVPFGYQSTYWKYIAPINVKLTKNILTEDGLVSYIGEFDDTLINDFPVTKINSVPTEQIIFNEAIVFPYVFIEPSYVFIRVSGSNFDTPNTIIIYGLDIDGVELSESIDFFSNQYVISAFKYKAITRIVGENYELTDRLDCDPSSDQISYTNSYGPQKRITTLEGEYFQPGFVVENNYIYVNNGNKFANNEVYKFTLLNTPDKIFISNTLDIFYTHNGLLCTSKMYQDYVELSQYNSTFNNNDFIVVDNVNPSINDTVLISVNIDLISKLYSNGKFRIRVISEDPDKYIDLQGQDTIENKWFGINETGLKSYIPYIVLSESAVTFVLEILNSNQEYTAGYYFNNLPEFRHFDQVDDLFFKNNELLIEKAGVITKLDLVRPFFMSSKTDTNIPLLIFAKNYEGINLNV